MHVLIIHQAFASFDEPGGTRHYELARMLVKHGHRVTIIASPVSYITGEASLPPRPAEGLTRSRRADAHPNLRIRRARVYAAHHRSFVHRSLAFLSFMVSAFMLGLEEKDVDVVWGTSPPISQGLSAWLLARLKGAPLLFEVRDLWPKFAVAVGVLRSRLLIGLAEGLERFLYRRADAIIVNSPGFIQHVSERGGRHVVLVPNGADPAMFDPDRDGQRFRARWNVGGKFVALYAGAHGMSNDLERLLQAASLVAGEPIHIVLVGDGKEKPALILEARRLGLGNVTFAEPVAKREMPEVLAAAGACIAILRPLPEYRTTYPNKVFDYMAAGRPVVLAIEGVIREVVERAQCGVCVEPGNAPALADALRELARDPVRARRMGRNGRRYLEKHFSREAGAATLRNLLKDLVTRNRRPSS